MSASTHPVSPFRGFLADSQLSGAKNAVALAKFMTPTAVNRANASSSEFADTGLFPIPTWIVGTQGVNWLVGWIPTQGVLGVGIIPWPRQGGLESCCERGFFLVGN